MALDEQEEVQIALALSLFQSEVSLANGRNLSYASPFAPFHCWDGTATHITGIVCPKQDEPKAFHLRPSVGTWMLPLPKGPKPLIMPTQADLIDLSAVGVKSDADLPNLSITEEPKITEASSLVSSRQGAVCCGA